MFTAQENEAALAARRILRARAKAIAICLSLPLTDSQALTECLSVCQTGVQFNSHFEFFGTKLSIEVGKVQGQLQH